MTALVDFDVIVYTAAYGGKGDFLSSVEIVDLYVDRIKFWCCKEGDEMKGFLSGPNNFRFGVATIQPYKGTRKSEKPPFYQSIRDYTVYFHGAEITDGMEADDSIALLQTENTIICSTDKDLKTVPGYNFNFKTEGLIYITPEEAMTNFFTQCLIGDEIDNIPGLKNPEKEFKKNGERRKKPPNFSLETSTKLLKGKTPQQQFETVADLFKQQYGESHQAAMHEVLTLLWIQRKDQITYKDCNLFNTSLVY